PFRQSCGQGHSHFQTVVDCKTLHGWWCSRDKPPVAGCHAPEPVPECAPRPSAESPCRCPGCATPVRPGPGDNTPMYHQPAATSAPIGSRSLSLPCTPAAYPSPDQYSQLRKRTSPVHRLSADQPRMTADRPYHAPGTLQSPPPAQQNRARPEKSEMSAPEALAYHSVEPALHYP